MSTIHWAEHAACAGTPIDLWFPSAGQAAAALATAQRYCTTCPVWDDCLAEDLAIHTVGRRHGIRAGLPAIHRDHIAQGTQPRPTQPPPPPLTRHPTIQPARRGATAVSVTELETPRAATATPTNNDELIAWGASHTSTRVQALAARARAALNDLAEIAAREEVVAAAEARVKRLKAQLANAEQDLRAAKNGTAKPQAAAPKAARDYAAIRAWAREQGLEVGAVGIPKRAVLDAYDTAHAQDAA